MNVPEQPQQHAPHVEAHQPTTLPKHEMAQADEALRNAHVMCNSEVFLLMEEYKRQRRDRDPNFQAPPLVQKTIEYVSKFNLTQNPDSLRHLRAMCEERGLHALEWGLLANLAPASPDEACNLVPSLKEDPEDPDSHRHLDPAEIQSMLEDIQNYRERYSL